MKIAILTPNKSTYTETFIQNHIDYLPFEKIVIYGAPLPYLMHNKEPSLNYRRWYKYKSLFNKVLRIKTEDFKEHELKKHLKEHKIDVVFAEYLNTGVEVLNVCKVLKIPMIAIGLGYEISQYKVLEKYHNGYKALFQYAKSIIIVSNHMRENLKVFNCPINKIVYSPASPKEDFFDLNPQFLKKQILAVGRFVDKKAPDITIRAFSKVLKEIPNANLVMAGDGYLLQNCKELVVQLGIQDAVTFLGSISNEQHKKLLEESFMFVQHSKVAQNGDSEGTPVAILEASAAALPIVSTIHAGIPEVVINNETGFLVNENDVQNMADKMIKLLQDKALSIQLGVNGRHFIKSNFTLKRHIEIISKTIKEACV